MWVAPGQESSGLSRMSPNPAVASLNRWPNRCGEPRTVQRVVCTRLLAPALRASGESTRGPVRTASGIRPENTHTATLGGKYWRETTCLRPVPGRLAPSGVAEQVVCFLFEQPAGRLWDESARASIHRSELSTPEHKQVTGHPIVGYLICVTSCPGRALNWSVRKCWRDTLTAPTGSPGAEPAQEQRRRRGASHA